MKGPTPEELDADRRVAAVDALYDIINEYNGSDYEKLVHIEEVLLFTIALRMAASANEKGEETFPTKAIKATVAQAVNDGKELIKDAQQNGTLPKPFKLVKPGGGLH